MSNQTKKNSVVITTLISALFFCSILILGSLSPLADSGPNANTFGSLNMWLSIGMILILYILPLVLYMLGVNFSKFVMAAFCSIGLLITVTIVLIMLVLVLVKAENFSENLIPSLGVIGSCLGATITNIIWFVIAFKSSSKVHKAL
ncbi:DUF5391 family protein [Ectobacillus panaciterrae]|uniref:DUF5391 family protein n=1 Tax=Ectobacillus panaciterrae TaxID=363872 RepID=UPI0009D688D4|nr:DUF5391 family protein [Ectobacillus panaciterrae]